MSLRRAEPTITPPPTAVADPRRLAALRRLALLDTPAEEAFDRLTRLAAKILDAPVCLVSLVDEDREFFKSCIGLPEPWASRREAPLSHAFCQYNIATGQPLVIEDARQHPLVCDNLAIRDLGVVAYVGIPLITADGHALGSFCMIDSRPRRWTEQEVQILAELAASVMTEIELRALAQEAERGRRERQALLDARTEGIFGVDARGTCTFINPAAQELLGYRADECLGKNMHELAHYKRPDGSPYPTAECPIVRAFSGGRAIRLLEEVLWRKDGTPLDALYSCSPLLEDGQVVGGVVTIVDITERRQAEAERERLLTQAQAAEARYRGLFGGVADAILVADAEGRYLDINRAATELLGYAREDLLQLRVPDVVATRPEWTEAEYARFLQEGSWHGELELRRRDGELVPVEAWATTIRLPAGVVYVSAVRDISERRALEQLQREFIAMVTHELRTPVTAIKGFAQLMQRRGARAEMVDVIAAEADRLQRLVGDLLDVSRLDARQLELRRSSVDLAATARAVADQATVLSEEHAVVVDAPEGPLEGWWDRERLGQVLHNLVANAIKYSPSGGEVRVRVEDLGQQARVSVADQGIGIAADALPRLFDRFYRTEAAAASGTTGLGVGLYIAKSLVEAHGGQIWADSGGEGHGTTFTFTLPYEPTGQTEKVPG